MVGDKLDVVSQNRYINLQVLEGLFMVDDIGHEEICLSMLIGQALKLFYSFFMNITDFEQNTVVVNPKHLLQRFIWMVIQVATQQHHHTLLILLAVFHTIQPEISHDSHHLPCYFISHTSVLRVLDKLHEHHQDLQGSACYLIIIFNHFSSIVALPVDLILLHEDFEPTTHLSEDEICPTDQSLLIKLDDSEDCFHNLLIVQSQDYLKGESDDGGEDVGSYGILGMLQYLLEGLQAFDGYKLLKFRFFKCILQQGERIDKFILHENEGFLAQEFAILIYDLQASDFQYKILTPQQIQHQFIQHTHYLLFYSNQQPISFQLYQQQTAQLLHISTPTNNPVQQDITTQPQDTLLHFFAPTLYLQLGDLHPYENREQPGIFLTLMEEKFIDSRLIFNEKQGILLVQVYILLFEYHERDKQVRLEQAQKSFIVLKKEYGLLMDESVQGFECLYEDFVGMRRGYLFGEYLYDLVYVLVEEGLGDVSKRFIDFLEGDPMRKYVVDQFKGPLLSMEVIEPVATFFTQTIPIFLRCIKLLFILLESQQGNFHPIQKNLLFDLIGHLQIAHLSHHLQDQVIVLLIRQLEAKIFLNFNLFFELAVEQVQFCLSLRNDGVQGRQD